MKRFLALLLVIVVTLGSFTSCKQYDDDKENSSTSTNGTQAKNTNEELITEKIETFLTAYNTGDMEAVLKCLDSKSRNAFQAMLNLLGGLAGAAAGFNIDLSDLFSLGVNTAQGDFMGLEITDINIIDSANAIATTIMNLAGARTETIYFEMVYENDSWYIHDMTGRKPEGLNNSQGDSTNNGGSTNTDNNTNNDTDDAILSSYEIDTCEPFVDGRAWVTYYESGGDKKTTISHYGFINTYGDILYSIPSEDGVEVYNIGKGSGIVCSKDRIILIDNTGETKLELTGQVELKHYGGGYAWIYQNKSTITSLEHLYGIVDHNGVWIEPMQNLHEIGLYDDMKYIGNGFVGAIGRDSVVYPIWNVDKNIRITIDGYVSDRHITFDNGIALVNRSHYYGREGISITVTKTDSNGAENTVVYDDIHLDCMIYSDGRVLPMENRIPYLNGNKAFYDGKAVSEVFDLENGVINPYYQITDYTKDTPTSVEFSAYPISQIEAFIFNGNYGLVQIRGLDEEVYVTMIDLQGNELITPIKGLYLNDFILTSDGYTYYRIDGAYYIVDKNNNIIKTDINWYVSFDNSDNIGMIYDYRYGRSYIKSNGEKLFDSLNIK